MKELHELLSSGASGKSHKNIFKHNKMQVPLCDITIRHFLFTRVFLGRLDNFVIAFTIIIRLRSRGYCAQSTQ